MAILLEKSRPDGRRVTAGIPSLDSDKRRSITDRQLNKLYQKALVSEYSKREACLTDTDGGRSTNDIQAQIGIPLTSERIITRLRKLNPAFVFERSNADPDKYGVYITVGQEKQFLVGMEAGVNPEFTVKVLNEDGTFKKLIPGWRRILMRLIRAKLISEPKAFAIFGPPNRDSELWARFTA